MRITIRWTSPWLRILACLFCIVAYLLARGREIRFVYEGF
jgi:hypothetical protein